MKFIQRMVDPNVGTGATDVYGEMFACQFIIFLIILFSWSAFAEAEVSNLKIFCTLFEIFHVKIIVLFFVAKS